MNKKLNPKSDWQRSSFGLLIFCIEKSLLEPKAGKCYEYYLPSRKDLNYE
jgi:hypothetical protein